MVSHSYCFFAGLIGKMFFNPRTTERANPYFVLQRRKGHGTKGLSSILVGTLDSVFDTRPPPFRILHQTPSSELSFVIACSLKRDDIFKDWNWIEINLMPTLEAFEKEDEITDFVKCKIESILAQDSAMVVHTGTSSTDGAGPSTSSNTSSTFTPGLKALDVNDSNNFKAAVHKFQNVFAMPIQEKLVNCEFFLCFQNAVIGPNKHFLFRLFLQFLEEPHASPRMALSQCQPPLFLLFSLWKGN